MSWVTVLFAMTASACLTMAFVYGVIWWRQRDAWAELLFALAALGAAALAGCDLAEMRAVSPEQLSSAIQWMHLAIWVSFLSLAGFVRLYLRAGRMWLLWTICALRTASLFLNYFTGENLNYREITKVLHVSFLGESVSAAAGIANHWMVVGELSLLGMVIFVADAAITVWRRGDHRQAVVVGGSIIFFVIAGAAQGALAFWRIFPWPLTPGLLNLGIVAAMGYELAGAALRADRLARDLTASEQRLIKADLESLKYRNEVAHLLRVASLGELSSALTHELRQPLTAILSNAQAAQLLLAREKCGLQEIDEILCDIVEDDKRACEVIGRLRTLLAKGEFQLQPLEANELIQEVLKLMNHELTAREVRVVLDFTSGLTAIRGDSVQLQQVLINLILNATDAMSQRAANARTLTLRSSSAPGDGIEISVADTGCGIPPGLEEKIFEPYHTTKPQGLGLGLSLSRSIVIAHGGRLWAENRTGGGATFHCAIPAWKGDQAMTELRRSAL
jgi:signal transduction histidine kinase